MALIVALAVALAAAPLAARLAQRLDVVDRPGPHKVQAQPVPYLGGVAMLVALAGPLGATRPVLLVPIGLAFLLGLADDLADLPVRLRLPLEAVIGVAAALAVPSRGIGGALLTVAFVVVLVNAVNLLDGLDGLAVGVGVASAVGFAVVLEGDFRTAALALVGAQLGFAVWNRPPARIYLGDSGSYLIGTALAVLLAAAFGDGQAAATSAGALLFVAVAVMDTTVAIVRRLRARRPLFEGDRGHVYDQLVDRGWPPGRVTLACIAAQAVLTAVGITIAMLSATAAGLVAGIVIVAVAVLSLRMFTSPDTWAS